MSWSFHGQGKASHVLAKSNEYFLKTPAFAEPEQGIRLRCYDAICAAVGAMPPDYPVTVVASGWQSTTKTPDGNIIINNVELKINPFSTI